MKKYFVKKVSTGTKDNPNFAGKTHVFIIGKGGELYHLNQMKYIYDCGWSRRHFAQRYIKEDMDFEQTWKARYGYYWDDEYEILEYETEEEMENEALRMENILGL